MLSQAETTHLTGSNRRRCWPAGGRRKESTSRSYSPSAKGPYASA